LRCANRRTLIEARGALTQAVLCPDCAALCPRCHNERTVPRIDAQGYEVLDPCSCQRLLARVARFNQAEIPARYRHCSLRDYIDYGGNQREVMHRVRRHLDAFAPGKPGLLLAGKVGTGKTHLLVGMLTEITLEAGLQARFVEFTHLLSSIKEGFNEGRNEADVLAPVSRIPVLGIDELGKGLSTEWQLSILDEIISRRYNAGLSTFFTTNLALRAPDVPVREPVTGQSGELRRALESLSLHDRVGDRIFSRLHEMCELVWVDGPDHRRERPHERMR
jgi:DNA replication protein DnaC